MQIICEKFQEKTIDESIQNETLTYNGDKIDKKSIFETENPCYR